MSGLVERLGYQGFQEVPLFWNGKNVKWKNLKFPTVDDI